LRDARKSPYRLEFRAFGIDIRLTSIDAEIDRPRSVCRYNRRAVGRDKRACRTCNNGTIILARSLVRAN
jgi:hypothetical protein